MARITTPKACLTRTIHAPGFGSAVSPAPAIGQGTAMPTPSRNGRPKRDQRALRVEIARKQHDLNDDRRHARAGEQRRDRPPCRTPVRRVPLPDAPAPTDPANREKSIVTTSNIASASTAKTIAIETLNQGEALMVPNVLAVVMTITPSTPYTSAIAAPYTPPSRKPRDRDPAFAPAPMIARLIGIIGSTHGVRLSARPPRNTSSRIASGPRPSNSPFSLMPLSAFLTNVRNSSTLRYPPVDSDDW